MTIITKPISEKKTDILDVPLVENDQLESLPAKEDVEAKAGLQTRYLVLKARARRISTATTWCLFLTALLVMSIGIIGGVYLYQQFAKSQMHKFRGWCSIPYDASGAYLEDRLKNQPTSSLFSAHNQLKGVKNSDTFDSDLEMLSKFFNENFELDLENEYYEKIDVPDFKDGRRGRFIHDFHSNKTGIVDLDGHRCFVMPLNRNRVYPPRSMHDLIKKMWNGDYDIDTEVIRETMRVVVPPVSDLDSVGTYISRDCKGFPTYMLEKEVSGVWKRSVLDDSSKFAEFAGNNVLELDIINIQEALDYESKSKE